MSREVGHFIAWTSIHKLMKQNTELRVSDNSAKALRDWLEEVVKNLTINAEKIAKAGKRNTILTRDITFNSLFWA